MLIFLISIASVLNTSAALAAETPIVRDFETDGCTLYHDGPQNHPNQWRHCCVEHDFHYWAGGSALDRGGVDVDLRECVRATGANDAAEIIYLGVRLGGHSPIKNKGKQWGNAWGNGRRKTALTKLEVNELAESFSKTPTPDLSEESRMRLIDDLHRRAEGASAE